MPVKRVILELGTGNDLHGGDYTKAALRAVQDALHHSSLSFIRTLGLTQAVAYRGIGNRPQHLDALLGGEQISTTVGGLGDVLQLGELPASRTVKELGEQTAQHAVERLRESGVDFEIELVPERPAEGLVHVAQQRQALVAFRQVRPQA